MSKIVLSLTFKTIIIALYAYRMKFITAEQLKKIAEPLVKSGYGQYLLRMVEG